jgi:hypothetical protein
MFPNGALGFMKFTPTSSLRRLNEVNDVIDMTRRILGLMAVSTLPQMDQSRIRVPWNEYHWVILNHILRAATTRRVSDPKDRIFALLQLFRMMGIELQEPDYKMSQALIYAQATKAIISRTGSLFSFAFNKPNGDTTSLPSWAIDFRKPWTNALGNPSMVFRW